MKILFLFLFLFFASFHTYSNSLAFERAKDLYYNQEYYQSIQYFNKCLDTSNFEDQIIIYTYTGICYLQINDYTNSIEEFQKGLKIAIMLDDKESMSNIYNNIGLVYDMNKQYEESKPYHIQSLKMAKILNDSLSIAASLNNLSSVYLNLNENEIALSYASKALRLNKMYDEKYGQILNYQNIGNIYRNMNKCDFALHYHFKSLEISKKLNYEQQISALYENISEDYLCLHNFDKSKEFLKKSEKINDELSLTYYNEKVYERLSYVYEQLEIFDSSLYYHKKYTFLKDSIFSQESKEKISYLDIKYKSKEQEIEILNLRLKNKDKEETILNHKIRNIFMISIIFIIAIFLFFSIIFYKKVRKALTRNKEITKELKIKNQDVKDSIDYAEKIQKGILSSVDKFKHKIYQSFIFFRPKDILSGDFYWSKMKNGLEFFAAGDCTGHGVPGSLLSIVGCTSLTRIVNDYGFDSPDSVLNKLNHIMYETFLDETVQDGMDISFCVLDRNTNILQCAMANNPVYIIRSVNSEALMYDSIIVNDKVLYKIKPDKCYVGYGNEFEFTNHTIPLEEGDMIYIFSDGYADQFGGEKGKKLKYKKFQNILLELSYDDVEKQEKMIEEIFDDWKGKNEQIDDVIVIGIRI